MLRKVIEFVTDQVGSNALQFVILLLTGVIAVLGLTQWAVKGIEDERANKKSTEFQQEISDQAAEIVSLTQSLAESSAEIMQNQEQLRLQAETNDYANDIANSPRLTVEWGPRNTGDPWVLRLTNNSDRSFSNTYVDFYTTYKLFDEDGLVEDVAHFRDAARSGVEVRDEFEPGVTVTFRVPTFPHTLNQESLTEYTHVAVETTIGIRADEYLPVLDDERHKIILRSYYDRQQNYVPQYVTNEAQPLLIHREVNFARKCAQ